MFLRSATERQKVNSRKADEVFTEDGFGDLREETGAGFRSWGERVVALEDRVEGMEAKRG